MALRNWATKKILKQQHFFFRFIWKPKKKKHPKKQTSSLFWWITEGCCAHFHKVWSSSPNQFLNHAQSYYFLQWLLKHFPQRHLELEWMQKGVNYVKIVGVTGDGSPISFSTYAMRTAHDKQGQGFDCPAASTLTLWNPLQTPMSGIKAHLRHIKAQVPLLMTL